MKNVYKVVLISLAVLGVVYADTKPDVLTQDKRNKELVRWAVNALNRGDWEAMKSLYSPRFVQHSPASQKPIGWEDYELGCRITYKKLPGLRRRIEDIIAEGDKVAVRLTLSATFTSNKGTRYEKKKTIEMTEIDIIRIAHGLIVEEWVECDTKQAERFVIAMKYGW
ncbi:hypothetical protein ES703_13575 [subsurface metagenome]